MFKPINDLTERDKLWFFEMYQRDILHDYDVTWEDWEKKIQARIDEIFDDQAFSKLSATVARGKAKASKAGLSELDILGSDLYFKASRLDSVKEARDYFHWNEKHEKPSILDFLLWERKGHDDTVYVPSSKPRPLKSKPQRRPFEISTEQQTEQTKQSSAFSSDEATVQSEKKPKTATATSSKGNKDDKGNKAKKTSRLTAGTATRRAGMRGIDKIRMLAAWAEGMMMPNYEDYEENTRKNNKHNKEDKKLTPTEMLRRALKKATVAIRENPIEFLKDKDFCDLIDLAKNTHGAFRLTASFPASFLKNKGILKLLPLPVKIGKVANIAMATGHDEDMVTFDWFSTDDPNPDRETMLLISDFLGALFEAINAF